MTGSLVQTARAWFGLRAASGRVPARAGVFPTTIDLPQHAAYDTFTRAYNWLGAAIGILLLSPLLIAIAVAVKLTSPGPALYHGERVGKDQARFHIFKFRTMKTGSEQKIGKRLVQQDEDHYTPIGKFLRKFRLDELAQLLNVIRGDMNLVGPRPMRPIFLNDLLATVPGYARRFTVRPGITGQAQVRGGYYTTPRHKLFYDALYIARRSVLLDLQLIVLTFLRVMTRIFTSAFLLAWLLIMAVVLPTDLQQTFMVKLSGLEFNLLYLAPPLIALTQLVKREIHKKRIYALRTPVDLPLLGFILVTAVLVLTSRFPLTALRGLLWWLCNGVVVFYLVLNSRLVTEHRSALIGALVGSVTAASGVALYQIADGLWTTGIYTRPDGTLGSPLLMSAIIVLTLPLSITALQFATRPNRKRLYGLTTVILAATAALTLSRSGILASALALGITYWATHRRWAITMVLGFGLAVAGLWSAGDGRLQPQRALHDLQQQVQRQTAIFGELTPARIAIGAGARSLPSHVQTARRFTAAQHPGRQSSALPSIDNTYLTVLADHGPLGLAFFLAWFLGALVLMYRGIARIPDRRVRADLRATAAGLTGFAVLMLFSDVVYKFPTMILFFAAMGLGVGLALQHRAGPKAVYRLVHYRHQL
jgi:lipopolysaccharide/colanic/teichoic acid biosynthesis glycosyltransferase